MSLSAISDLHIKEPNDKGHELLKRFLSHPLVRSSDHIALLGDIFDIWVGDIAHKYKDFKDIFDELAILSNEGRVIYYFEGNHDLHLRNLEMKIPHIQYVPEHAVLSINGHEVLISHGDWFDDEDEFYYRYRRFIGSRKLAKLIFGTIGEGIINMVGAKASKISRARGSSRYSSEVNTMVTEKFRKLAHKVAAKEGIKTIIWGHSHAKDLYKSDDLTYLNNGFAPIEEIFNYISSTGIASHITLKSN